MIAGGTDADGAALAAAAASKGSVTAGRHRSARPQLTEKLRATTTASSIIDLSHIEPIER